MAGEAVRSLLEGCGSGAAAAVAGGDRDPEDGRVIGPRPGLGELGRETIESLVKQSAPVRVRLSVAGQEVVKVLYWVADGASGQQERPPAEQLQRYRLQAPPCLPIDQLLLLPDPQ